MKVILTQNDDNLGDAGDIVNVKPGYARNYLIPRKIALEVTPSNLKVYEEAKKREGAKKNRELISARKIAEQMSKLSLTASVQVGEEDKIFGAVTALEVEKLLADKGFEIDKRDVILEEPIKALGIYNVGVKIHPEVKAEVKLWVIKE